LKRSLFIVLAWSSAVLFGQQTPVPEIPYESVPNFLKLPADLYLCLVGVKPALGFLEGSGVAAGTGILVDESMRTTVPDIFAAGDVAEFRDCVTGQPLVNAIQPNATDQGRIAALGMAGRKASSKGSLACNVLDTLGLISYSFGAWQGLPLGEHAELADPDRFRYLRLEFLDDRLVGANVVGLTEHAGVLRALIEGKVPLGPWKQRLLHNPNQLMEAYLAQGQRQDQPYEAGRPLARAHA